jgi:hypothetical protein
MDPKLARHIFTGGGAGAGPPKGGGGSICPTATPVKARSIATTPGHPTQRFTVHPLNLEVTSYHKVTPTNREDTSQ